MRYKKDLEPILNTMQLHGQWIDGSFFGKNDDYHAKSFLLNYGAHAAVPVLGNDKAVIINCD